MDRQFSLPATRALPLVSSLYLLPRLDESTLSEVSTICEPARQLHLTSVEMKDRPEAHKDSDGTMSLALISQCQPGDVVVTFGVQRPSSQGSY